VTTWLESEFTSILKGSITRDTGCEASSGGNEVYTDWAKIETRLKENSHG